MSFAAHIGTAPLEPRGEDVNSVDSTYSRRQSQWSGVRQKGTTVKNRKRNLQLGHEVLYHLV